MSACTNSAVKAEVDPLNELDKAEWFDVVRKIKPDLEWAEYEKLWDEFQAYKSKRELH